MDQIDAAIGKVEHPTEARFGGRIALLTGRVVAIDVPADLTDTEYLEVIVILAAKVRPAARQSLASPLSRIVAPGNGRVI